MLKILLLTFLIGALAQSCPDGYSTTPNDILCDVLIIGTGPSGLLTGYHLKDNNIKVCMIDKKTYFGGKVRSIEAPQSTPTNRLYSPTCAEMLRYTDINMRCLAQEMGVESYSRNIPWNNEYIDRGYNVTNVCEECYEDGTLLYDSYERYLAPNGIAPIEGMKYPVNKEDGVSPAGLPNCCEEGDNYTVCSYMDCIFDRIVYPDKKGLDDLDKAGSFAEWAYRQTDSGLIGDYFGKMIGYYYTHFQKHMPYQAKAGYDYLNYDWNAPWGGVLFVQNGMQQIWLGVANLLQGLPKYNILLNETATCIDKNIYNDYVVRTDKRNIVAKKLVLGMSPYDFVNTMKGGVVATTISNKLNNMGVTDGFLQCTLNIFFNTSWWVPYRGQCTDGLCHDPKYKDHPNITKVTGWTLYETNTGFWFRHVPTPDRVQMHMLRFFPDQCEEYVASYKQLGKEGLKNIVMTHIHKLLDGVIPVEEPLDIAFNYESAAYSYISARAPKSTTVDSLKSFAKNPYDGGLCFVSEQFDFLHSGWQEGAAHMVKQCFDSALKVYNNPNTWDQCTNKNDGKKFTINSPSLTDECYMLKGEYHTLDYYGLDYCSNKKRNLKNNSQTKLNNKLGRGKKV